MTRMVSRLDLADAGQVIAPLPFGRQCAKNSFKTGSLMRVVDQKKRLAARGFEKFAIAQWIGDVETHIAGLPGAEEVAGTTEEEVGFGNFEAVRGAHHGGEAFTSDFREAAGGDEDRSE